MPNFSVETLFSAPPTVINKLLRPWSFPPFFLGDIYQRTTSAMTTTAYSCHGTVTCNLETDMSRHRVAIMQVRGVHSDFSHIFNAYKRGYHKNIERQTADTIVSWPNPKQWVIIFTSDLMMIIIRQSIYILSIITRESGKLKTYSPTYSKMDNGENMLNLTHTLDKIYLTGIL